MPNALDGYITPPGPVLDTMTLGTLEELAQGLSKPEILDLYNIREDELEPTDRYNLNQAIKKGKATLIKLAVHNLKTQMAGKNGLQASLAALTRFGEKWEHTDAVTGARKLSITFDE